MNPFKTAALGGLAVLAQSGTMLAQDAAPSPTPAVAVAAGGEDDRQALKFVESDVISLVDREGFRWQDKRRRFLLHPYVFVQTRLQLLYVDDEGLDLADHDNVVDVGFGIPNAILGVAGKAFERLSFNLAFNGGCAGKGCLLTEAWLEGNVADELRIRTGKLKTPMSWHVQTRLAQKIAPASPSSLTTRVNIPFDINSVNPVMATGFDLGVMAHGVLGSRLQYQLGVFNGEGIQVNVPTSNLSDDFGLPALLYAARLAWTPLGPLELGEGGPRKSHATRLSVGASTSYNVETNAESSNDLRAGLELVLSASRWYWATEGYLLHMDFVERMKQSPSYTFWGANTVLAYLFGCNTEAVTRLDVFDRNGQEERGLLMMPGIGVNHYAYGQNLKIQAMYQYLARVGHADDLAANDDDNQLGRHTGMVQLQFSF